MAAKAESAEERVLVFAPSGRDGPSARAVLAQAGITSHVCPDLTQLMAMYAAGAGTLVVSQEALTPGNVSAIRQALAEQEPWSDIPVIVFLSPDEGYARRAARVLAELGNATVVERPVSPINMISAVQAALRARRRQLQIREHLRQRENEIRQRDQFLAMLGHELRNPLSAIRNAFELIRLKQKDPDEISRPLQIVERQTGNLAKLVDDLLDVSRITTGKVILQLRQLDLRTVVASAQQSLEGVATARCIQMLAQLPDRPLWLRGDPVRLEQVLTNLLANALKYTPRGGRVEIVASHEDREAVVTISDTGVGIAPDMLSQIFDPFVQSERALDRAQGGMGIGLTIVRALVERHQGLVKAQSAGIGQGACFTVRLPVVADPAPELSASSPVETAAAAGRHVLIVEDNVDNRETLKMLLETLGFRVDVACDGAEGVQRMVDLRPEVALVDIGLPALDGYEVARRVRGAMGRDIFLVALTGYGQPEDQQRTAAAGFDAHLTKPASLPALVAMLSQPRHEPGPRVT